MKKIDQLRTKVVNAAIANYQVRKQRTGGNGNEWALLDKTIEDLLRFIASTEVMYGKAPEDKYLTQEIYGGGYGTKTICILCYKSFWAHDVNSWTQDYDRNLYDARQHVKQYHT